MPRSERRPPVAVRLARLEELELVIERLVAGGDGLGRFEGIPIFVPRSAPGDRLRVRLVERRPDYGRAEIEEILEPGPGRRRPPCPYFSRCGGCDLQHLEDDLQVRLKVAALEETLERLGGLEERPPTEVVAGEAWGYRLRAQLHVESRADGARVGYFERGSRRLVAVDRCPILVPELDDLLATLPARLPAEPPSRLDVACGGGDAVTAAPAVGDLPRGEVTLAIGEFNLGFDARCFFQAHRELLPELVARAVGPWEGEEAVDLYCGVGLFSLPLARRYRRVTGVDVDRLAVRFARRNARRNRMRGVEVVAHAVEGWVDRLPEGVDRVLVDPPRTGLARRVRRALLARRPRRVTYVSCHPATLARDLRELTEAYRLESVTALDMFPQSGHLEVVAQLA